jgi:hypothetical protein
MRFRGPSTALRFAQGDSFIGKLKRNKGNSNNNNKGNSNSNNNDDGNGDDVS